MKIAQFHDTRYDFDCIRTDEESNYRSHELVRTSDWIDVNFVSRPMAEVVPEQVAAIDADRAEVVAKFTAALALLDDRKAKLLAIGAATHG